MLSEIDSKKTQRMWGWTSGCTNTPNKSARDFCQDYHKLSAELASAQQSDQLTRTIASIKGELAKVDAPSAMSRQTRRPPFWRSCRQRSA